MVLVLVFSFTSPGNLKPAQQANFVVDEKVAAITLWQAQRQAQSAGALCNGELFEMDLAGLKLIKRKIPEVIIG